MIQETWLLNWEANLLDKVKTDYVGIHQSGMPATRTILQGCPYGGLGFIIKKSILSNTKLVNLNDPRLLGLSVQTDAGNLLIVNKYFPVNCASNEQLITQYIAKLDAIILDHNGPILIAGDFNISPHKAKFAELIELCCEKGLCLFDVKNLPATTITFCSKGQGYTMF